MTEKKNNTFGLLIICVGIPLYVLLRVFVVQRLWNWFIAPIFGLHAIAFLAAMGLNMTYIFLSGIPGFKSKKAKDEDWKKWTPAEMVVKSAEYGFFQPLAILLTGALIHHFMR